jgi:hypothetical protein
MPTEEGGGGALQQRKVKNSAWKQLHRSVLVDSLDSDQESIKGDAIQELTVYKDPVRSEDCIVLKLGSLSSRSFLIMIESSTYRLL